MLTETHDQTRSIDAARTPSLSLNDFAADLAKNGSRVFGCTNADFWIRHESLALMRMPVFAIGEPAPQVIDELMRGARAAVVSYLLEPDDTHPANASLYVCRDRDYAIDKLAPAVRRNIRRGTRELRIEPVTVDQVLAHGFQAFSDTRTRIGLSDGTRPVFTARFEARGKSRGHVFRGAWRGDELVAFLSITDVEDWAEIEGCFSSNAALNWRPNDTLMATTLADYLVSRRYQLVTYGLSSIQAVSNAAGLHEFKAKVGFDAEPVHRAFVPHPWLRPFVNPLTHSCVSALLTVAPANRWLKKCDGLLSLMLNRERSAARDDQSIERL